MLAFSTFGHPEGERSMRVIEAVRLLDQRRVDFEYEGDMAADVALNPELMTAYPFCRLSGPANVLVMPAFHSASISTKMLQELGGDTARVDAGRHEVMAFVAQDADDLGGQCLVQQLEHRLAVRAVANEVVIGVLGIALGI